jgi:hypothetical protein
MAMSLAKGLFGSSIPAGPDTHQAKPPMEMLKDGEYEYDSGIPVMSGINAAAIPSDVLDEMFQRRYENSFEEENLEWTNYP